jgi:HD-GYP domain-containing protein (c-di-GMP phosphodiesterase class II)
MAETATGIERLRAAEVIASLCMATDLGMGFPFEHGLQATVTTMRLCDALRVDAETASRAYYASLLMHCGCTVDAEASAHVFHGSMTKSGVHRMFGSPSQALAGSLGAFADPEASWLDRTHQVAVGLPRAARFRKPHFTALCEVAELLSEQCGLPASFATMFAHLTERWDGWSNLRRSKGAEIPLAMRITHVGRDAAYQRLVGDDAHVVETIRSRGGHAFDPAIVDAFVGNAPDVLGRDDRESVWEEVLAAEPAPWLTLEDASIDRALAAMGAFSDLASPHLSGHASGVGELAAKAGELLGLSDLEVKTVRRAGYVHDLGRTAVHPRIWGKPGPLSADEREQVRLHPYHTERVMARSPFLASLAVVAGSHHERLDGTGYHRGFNAAALPPLAWLLAAADAYRSKTESRAYRQALEPEAAANNIAVKTRMGKLEPMMASAVIEAAGQRPPRLVRPAGLTQRETQVLILLARGQQTKQMARRLGISAKTADRHIQNAYRKIGVSTRAAATLFAAQHGLVTWDERPTPNPRINP